jgi:hypothetical protein
MLKHFLLGGGLLAQPTPMDLERLRRRLLDEDAGHWRVLTPDGAVGWVHDPPEPPQPPE